LKVKRSILVEFIGCNYSIEAPFLEFLLRPVHEVLEPGFED